MALTTRLPLIFKLAYAYADDDKHEEAITLFQKFLFLLPKRDTIKDRIDVLLKLGELMQTVSRSHQELVTIYEELLEIGITSRDLDLQWEALCQLEWVHEKYNYNDKARICKEKKLEVERLKALESDKSVIDPEMNDDDDSGNNPEEPTLDLVDTDFDGFTTPPPRNQQESPASSTSKRKNDNANTGGSSSKKSKYQIQTLDLESDASEPSTPTNPTKQKSVVELLDSDSDLDEFFNNSPKSPAKNSKSNQKQKSRNTAVISSSPVTSQSLGKPPASSSAKNHTIFSSPTRSPVRTPRKPRNAIFGQEDTEIEIPDSAATPPPSTPPFRPVEIPQTPQSKNSSMMLNITLRDGETESEIQIPYSAGPTGTPKTVRWLMEETDKRYKNLTKTSGTFISRLLSANTQTGATRELRKTDCIPNAMKDQEIIIAQFEKSI
ncbi:hypothetical protein HK098_004031 [Nowakowskiella sp. JEL0407]|nr:hypothetical protein HK098_004031 [Nowakowskiella sp. JEL0407]